ncbi:MAG: metal-dependent transcriptional regulator [Archaeoglobaceae archaeon]
METKFIIKTLFIAWENGQYVVGPSDLAKKLGISKSTAQKILLKISKLGYGIYVERKGLILTEKGINEGKKLMRRHRLVECLLEDLGEELEKFIERKYGKRGICPCGKPIPSF